jgi:hypothetical protein
VRLAEVFRAVKGLAVPLLVGEVGIAIIVWGGIVKHNTTWYVIGNVITFAAIVHLGRGASLPDADRRGRRDRQG